MQKIIWLAVGVLIGMALARRSGRHTSDTPDGLTARIESAAREFKVTMQRSYHARQDELRSALSGDDRP